VSQQVETPTKWVMVSTELLAQLGEWSEPVRVKVVSDADGILDMVFQRYDEKEK
jgi:hypothetical protein